MVALLTGLKLRLLLNRLRSETWVVVGLIVGAVTGLCCTGLVATGAVLLAVADPDVAATVVVVAGSALVAGWAVVPVLAFGVDETLDPARFVTLPLRARDLVPALTVAGAVGVPGVATAVISLSVVGTWAGAPLAALLAACCAPVALATCVLASRTATAVGARLLSRRGREASAVLGIALLLGLAFTPSLLAGGPLDAVVDRSDLDGLAAVLGWTPLGAVWAGPADVATGHGERALIRLGLALLTLGVLALGYERLLAASLERPVGAAPASSRSPRRRPLDLLLDRLPTGPTWAIAVRSMRYWRRDPRFVVIVVTSLLATVVPLAGMVVDGSRTALTGVGVFVAFLLALSTSNTIGYDGSAFAAHLLTGVPGRADRAGRALGLLLWAVPLVVAVSVLGALLAGRPELAPAGVGAGAGMLLGGTGACALMGVWLPYPVVAAGGNPFQTNAGGGAQALLAQFGTMAAALTVGLPGIVGLVLSATVWPWLAWPTLVVGTAVGGAGAVAGCSTPVGRRCSRRCGAARERPGFQFSEPRAAAVRILAGEREPVIGTREPPQLLAGSEPAVWPAWSAGGVACDSGADRFLLRTVSVRPCRAARVADRSAPRERGRARRRLPKGVYR